MSKTKSSPSVRRLFRLTLLTVLIGFGIKAFLLAPLYLQFASDIAFANEWWVYILYYLTDGGLVDLAVFAICYPATLYAIRTEGLKASLSISVTYIVATILKFACNFFMTSITDGALPDWNEFVTQDLTLILGMLSLELAQYLLVIGIAVFVRWRYNTRVEIAEGMKQLPRNQRVEYPLPPPDFPFTAFYTRRNALQRGALLTAICIMCGRIIMHLVYQITLFAFTGVTDGWVVMLADLITDIIIGMIFYLVSLLLLMKFRQWEQKDAE